MQCTFRANISRPRAHVQLIKTGLAILFILKLSFGLHALAFPFCVSPVLSIPYISTTNKQQGTELFFPRRSCKFLLYIFITITKPDPEAIRPRPSAPVDPTFPKDSRLPRPVSSVSENANNSYARELEKVARQLRDLKATAHAQDDEIVRLCKSNERLSGEAKSSQETVASFRDRLATAEAMLARSWVQYQRGGLSRPFCRD